MKSQLFASAAFVLLSAVPGALSAEEANLQGAVAVTSFEDQLADFFDEEEVSEDEDEDNMDLWSWSGKSRKGCSRNLLDECEDARRRVRRGRRVRSMGRSFSSFRDLCHDACGVRIPRSSHRHHHHHFRDYDYGKSDKDWRDYRDYSGKSDKDDRDYSGSGKSDKDDRDSRDKGGKSDKSDFFNDEEASEDEDFILTDSGKGHRTVWWGSKGQRIWYGKSGHRGVVWHGPKSDKVASEDEGYDSVGDV